MKRTQEQVEGENIGLDLKRFRYNLEELSCVSYSSRLYLMSPLTDQHLVHA